MDIEHASTVDPTDGVEANRRNWDQRAPIHAVSEMYDLEGLISDPGRITDVVTDDLEILLPHLPDNTIRGLDVVHLQCHIGTDTLSLARLGANLAGVDFSPTSLAIARSLAERAGQDIDYVESEVTESHRALNRTFDVVYTSIGTITWLPNLNAWANAISDLLKPGGTFFIRDGHPVLYSLDENADTLLIRYPYFGDGTALTWDDQATYTDGDHSTITHTKTHEWAHPIAEVISVLLDSGLTILHFGEHQTLPWQALPRMIEVDGRFQLPDEQRNLLPLAFSVVARKPG